MYQVSTRSRGQRIEEQVVDVKDDAECHGVQDELRDRYLAHQASIHEPGHGVDQEEGTHEDQQSGREQPIEQKEATEDLAPCSHRPQTIMCHLLEKSTSSRAA